MKHFLEDIHDVLNTPLWELLQDHLAAISKLAILTINYKGEPITKHSACSPFCQSVRSDPRLNQYCQTCDSRGGLEAVRAKKPFIYLCHFNLVDFAVPIIVNDRYLGAIMAGQAKLTNDSKNVCLEQLLSYKKDLAIIEHIEKHYNEYMDIPELSFDEINEVAQFLSHLTDYMTANFLKRMDSEQQLPKNVNTILSLKKTSSDSKNDCTLLTKSDIIKTAIDQIYATPRYNYSLTEMAALCHLSPSYFSRLFTKETGQNYSTYVSHLKINMSKELLKQTDYSIVQISDNLGFNSPGYFTKVFKKSEGITPLMYRKYFQDSPS